MVFDNSSTMGPLLLWKWLLWLLVMSLHCPMHGLIRAIVGVAFLAVLDVAWIAWGRAWFGREENLAETIDGHVVKETLLFHRYPKGVFVCGVTWEVSRVSQDYDVDGGHMVDHLESFIELGSICFVRYGWQLREGCGRFGFSNGWLGSCEDRIVYSQLLMMPLLNTV